MNSTVMQDTCLTFFGHNNMFEDCSKIYILALTQPNFLNQMKFLRPTSILPLVSSIIKKYIDLEEMTFSIRALEGVFPEAGTITREVSNVPTLGKILKWNPVNIGGINIIPVC